MPKVGVDNEALLERLIFGFDGADYRVIKVDDTGQILAAVSIADTVEVVQDTYADLLATVKIASAQEIEVKQSVAASLLATVNIAASQSVIATQSTAANLKVLADINSGQSIAVTQATATNLKAQVALAADQNVQSRGYGWLAGAWQKRSFPLGFSSIWTEEKSNLSASTGTNILTGTTVPAGEIWDVRIIGGLDQDNNTTSQLTRSYIGGIAVPVAEFGAGVATVHNMWTGSFVIEEDDYVEVAIRGCTSGDRIYLRYYAIVIDIDQ